MPQRVLPAISSRLRVGAACRRQTVSSASRRRSSPARISRSRCAAFTTACEPWPASEGNSPASTSTSPRRRPAAVAAARPGYPVRHAVHPRHRTDPSGIADNPLAARGLGRVRGRHPLRVLRLAGCLASSLPRWLLALVPGTRRSSEGVGASQGPSDTPKLQGLPSRLYGARSLSSLVASGITLPLGNPVGSSRRRYSAPPHVCMCQNSHAR